MKLESFEYLIDKLKEASEKDHSFYALGLDLQTVSDPYHQIITHLLRVYYSEDGEDWISWYLYEKNGKEDTKAWDKDGNEICYDIPSLWKEVEEIRVSIDFKEYVPKPRKSQEEIQEEIAEILSKFKNNEF
jgi:hypothetical protein